MSICTILDDITFPTNTNELRTIQHGDGFFQIASFPRVIGAIDDTLIQIKKPQYDKATYICRKGYYAINVQTVCDSNLRR